jgi:peptidoglycan/LPS O-acetylase OafA/YrhL
MQHSRSNGLDTLRALAIVLVFCYHYRVFVSGEPTLGWLGTAGWVGVDLFFVLSGYLIGNQVFAAWVRGQPIALGAFYARRALRTWPVFWLVLAAYFLFPVEMGGRTPPPLWTFLTFTQNYQLQPGTAFSHAWSLCIEEQFYAVFPLVVWLAWRLRGRLPAGRALAWGLLAALLALGVGARVLLWAQFGREAGGNLAGYYPNIYYATLCRFDEFLPGLALALLKNFHPSVWSWIERSGRGLFVAGAAALALVGYGVIEHYFVDGYGYGFFMTAFGYSLVACAFALWVASALGPDSPLHRVRIPGAQSLALWSYSIYLIHKPVGFALKQAAVGWPAEWLLVAVVLASLALGAALYYAVERPFMRLRSRVLSI